MKSQEKGLIYLYCLTNEIPKLSRPVIETKAGSRSLFPVFNGIPSGILITGREDGMAGKESEDLVDNAHLFYYQGLYAVVSHVSTDEFSEENLKKNLADLEWVKDKATVHEKVIEMIMKNSCVIPFKFGTLFNTEDNLKAMLGEHLKDFKAILKRLENKEEWGIKLYCDIEKLKESLLLEDEDLLNMDKEINFSPPGKAFILKKKKEELLNTVMNKKLNEYGQYSFERLGRCSADARINKLLPKEFTERKDDMILNSAFLIDKNKGVDFLTIVEGLKAIFADKGLFFDCTGPWPPYNFCEATTYGAKRT